MSGTLKRLLTGTFTLGISETPLGQAIGQFFSEKFNRGISSGSQTNFTDISSNYNITNNIPNQTPYLVPSDKGDSIFIYNQGHDAFEVPFEDNIYAHLSDNKGHPRSPIQAETEYNTLDRGANEENYRHLDPKQRPPGQIQVESHYNKLGLRDKDNAGIMTGGSDRKQGSASDTVKQMEAGSNQQKYASASKKEIREASSAVYEKPNSGPHP